jgi:hypothetical protein
LIPKALNFTSFSLRTTSCSDNCISNVFVIILKENKDTIYKRIRQLPKLIK